jgi:hypothetical protein
MNQGRGRLTGSAVVIGGSSTGPVDLATGAEASLEFVATAEIHRSGVRGREPARGPII